MESTLLDQTVPIRMNFKGIEAEKFLRVKKWLGLEHNTEVVRVLISDAYHRCLDIQVKEGSS